jgi:hypothetical protein
MSKVELDNEEDKPLDPEMEKVRRKMVRLLGVSIGVMFLGVMAVLAGVVYKVIQTGDETPVGTTEAFAVPTDVPLTATAQLPAGFSIDDVSLDGSKILFYGRDAGGVSEAYVFDIVTGRMAARIDVRH